MADSGSFKWPNTTAGVSSVTATSPLFSSGGTAPNLTIQVANTSQDGYLSSTDWNTFNNKQAALTFGNLTDVGTDGITVTGGTGAVIGSGTSISQHVADSTHNGYLSSADWSAFNAKQAAGNYITALTGDGTASGPGSVALTLATVNSNVGSFGSASSVSAITVNAKGLVTAAASTAIQIAESQVTNLVSDLAGKQATGNYITALTSDITASGPGSVAATLATVNANVGSFGSATQVTALTVNAKGLVTAASNVSIAIPFSQVSGTVPLNQGGTGQTTKAAAFDALSPMSTGGDLIYGGASGTGTRLANGSSGQYLKSTGGTSAPAWSSFVAPTVQTFTSSSGTYTTPANVLYIRVKMVGGGGGGSGGGSGAGTGTDGGNSTFGTTLLVANGGSNGGGTTSGGAGGSASLGSGPIGTALTGGAGSGFSQSPVTQYATGGAGGNSGFGGGGSGGGASFAGGNGSANTGAGGGGGSTNSVSGNANSGAGGGAAGYVDALISSPSATYSYAVGAAGSGGAAGSSSSAMAGGNGGSGYIEVTEYYQ